jgi:hypothetical protein
MSQENNNSSGSVLWWPQVRRFIGGYFSGCALVLAGHPFDTVKVGIGGEKRDLSSIYLI